MQGVGERAAALRPARALSTCPVCVCLRQPGLDDGGNYAENRRVEFHVQPLSGEGDADDHGVGAHYSIDVFHQSMPTMVTSSL